VTTDWTDDHGPLTVRLGDDPGMWYADDQYGVRPHHAKLLAERDHTRSRQGSRLSLGSLEGICAQVRRLLAMIDGHRRRPRLGDPGVVR
jgi:hypothetical protein